MELSTTPTPTPTPAAGRHRHPLGILLLLTTVFLWTLSNFLASTLLADNTYSKPFLITYFNSAVFVIPLGPLLVWRTCTSRSRSRSRGSGLGPDQPLLVQIWLGAVQYWGNTKDSIGNIAGLGPTPSVGTSAPTTTRFQDFHEQSPLLGKPTEHLRLGPDASSSTSSLPSIIGSASSSSSALPLYSSSQINPSTFAATPFTPTSDDPNAPLSVLETAKLSLSFSFLWFFANFLASGCFQHTTVASGTILACTSGVWTLLFGVIAGVERLTISKLIGAVLSLTGVAMVSSFDISGRPAPSASTITDPSLPLPPRDPFHSKPASEIALGNAMALASAVVYGIYSVMIKKKVGSETRITMPLFFGFVGLFSILLLWPGFIILHFLNIEPFELPSSSRVVMIILINAIASLTADLAWAYAILLLDSPLLVTIGLSLSIPLSLIGQAQFYDITVGPVYWVGAIAVVFAFVLVDVDE